VFELKPWRQDEFKVSPDPDLVEKFGDIVGLYLNPPVTVAVFAVEEKPQIQALDRSAPILPTTPQRATHDYERNGTIDLFAALEVAIGKVIFAAGPRPGTTTPNRSPWHKSADDILQRLAGYCTAINQHATSSTLTGH